MRPPTTVELTMEMVSGVMPLSGLSRARMGPYAFVLTGSNRDCVQGCLQHELGENLQEFKQNLTKTRGWAPAVGAGVCGAIVLPEPELHPLYPECGVQLTINTGAVLTQAFAQEMVFQDVGSAIGWVLGYKGL